MTKENNGKAARRRATKKFVLVAMCALVLTVTILLCFRGSLLFDNNASGGNDRLRFGIPMNGELPRRLGAGGNNNNNKHRQSQRRHTPKGEIPPAFDETGMDPHDVAERYRQELMDQFDGSQDEIALLEDVVEARIHLVEIVGLEEEIIRAPKNSYSGVYGRFCRLNFAVHKENPSSVPMFRDILSHSDCTDPFNVDLKKVVYLAKERDRQVQESTNEQVPKVLNFTAAAFHESRCGSTLVANSMIAMDPEKHRTYSESAPPISAMKNICGPSYEYCSETQAAKILQDTIYMMSRTDDPKEERVFFKFQSATSSSISTFQMAFPDVPWMYVFREPVQVMMSHVKDDPQLKRAICTRTRFSGRHPKAIRDLAHRHGFADSRELEPSQYCAAHLASLTESAVNSLNDMAIPVNYEQLPNILWEKIMPKVFGRPLTQTEIDNMEAVSHDYSKGRGQRAGEFKGDSEQKARAASDAVKEAAEIFLQESFDQLNEFQPKLLQ